MLGTKLTLFDTYYCYFYSYPEPEVNLIIRKNCLAEPELFWFSLEFLSLANVSEKGAQVPTDHDLMEHRGSGLLILG